MFKKQPEIHRETKTTRQVGTSTDLVLKNKTKINLSVDQTEGKEVYLYLSKKDSYSEMKSFSLYFKDYEEITKFAELLQRLINLTEEDAEKAFV